MNLLSILSLLIAMAVFLMIGSVIFKSPRQNLQSAFAEGAVWGTSFFVAFSAEILLLGRI